MEEQVFEHGFFEGYESCYDELKEETMDGNTNDRNETPGLVARLVAQNRSRDRTEQQLKVAHAKCLDLLDHQGLAWLELLAELDRQRSEAEARDVRREAQHKEEVLSLQVALNRRDRRIAELEAELSRQRPGGRVIAENGTDCDLDVPAQSHSYHDLA